MEKKQQELWTRISDFEIDAVPVKLSFARRLARENGWTVPFAERVVQEYKRFVFLCMMAGHPCTPSDPIDQAWHLHMVYTESYWMRLCGEVLPRPLHHGPTKGGSSEDAKFEDWYERTLESYRRLFGTEPPQDIWRASGERFANAGAWRRVDTSLAWVVPKAPAKRATVLALPLALFLLIAGCGMLVGEISPGLKIALALALLLAVVIGVTLWASKVRRDHYDQGGCAGGGRDPDGCGSDSSGCGGGGCGGGCGGGGCSS